MRIAICIPTRGEMKAEFVRSLGNMLLRPLPDAEIRLLIQSGHVVTNRNLLFRQAVNMGVSHFLWLDDDHSFPDWALERLLSLKLPVVTVNQAIRASPTAPNSRIPSEDGKGERVYTTQEMADERHVQQVATTGLSLCLIDMRILVKLAVQANKEGRELYPMFAHVPAADPSDDLSEDGFFFRRLREAGVNIFVDHWLSWETRHISDRALTMQDTIDDREAFELLHKREA